MNPIVIGTVVLVALLGAGLAVQTKRVESCKAEHAAFVAQVKQNGEIAAKAAKLKEAQDAKQIKDAISGRDLALAKLHNTNPAKRNLSATASAPAGSNEVCLGSAAYNVAMERYRGRLERGMDGITGLAREGDAAQIDAIALIQAWPLKMAREMR